MKKTLLLPLAAGIMLASGCGSKQEADSSGSSANAVSAVKAVTATTPSDPKEVVQLFLDSMRAGNGARLSSLLSSLAREEIKRKQLEIAPLGSPNAVFSVGDAAPQNDGMLVSSIWTEPEQTGQPATKLEVVWELRKEPEGWRICGMAVDPMNGDDVQIVDFERLEPEQPQESRVASLPNSNAALGNNASPANFPQINNIPANNFPPNNNQPNNFAPSNNAPAGNFPPANNAQPAAYTGQPPVGNYPPANNYLPPATGFQPNLPAPNYPNQPTSGSPQPIGNQGSLPPIVSGNSQGSAGGFSFPPATNTQPIANDPNPIRR